MSLQAAKRAQRNNTKQNREPGVVLQLLECLLGMHKALSLILLALRQDRRDGACL